MAVGFLAPVAEAQAAQCTWQRSELPVPSPYENTSVSAVGGDYAAGIANSLGGQHGQRRVQRHRPEPGRNRPGSAVDDRQRQRCLRRQTRWHQPDLDGQDALVQGLNDCGDVVGYLWAPSGTTNVLVRAFENGQILGQYWQNGQWHGAGPSHEIRLWRNGVVDPNVPSPSPSGSRFLLGEDSVISGVYYDGELQFAGQWRCS